MAAVCLTVGFYNKIVIIITLFFTGVSGLFLVSGAGVPILRLMVFFVFFIGALNLSLYWREFGRWLNRTAHTAGAHLAEARTKKQEDENGSKNPPKAKVKKAVHEPRSRKYEEAAEGFDEENDDDFLDEDFETEEDFEFEDEDKPDRG